MSADKRKVTTDALETLGTIIDEFAGRDAIHLAVFPAIAGSTLYPGQHIGVDEKGVALTTFDKTVGIVDPFLVGPVAKDQRFWLIIYPRTITSLRHVWDHPDFPAEISNPHNDLAKQAAYTWIQEYARDILDMSAESLMSAAANYLDNDEYYYTGDREEYLDQEFWNHY